MNTTAAVTALLALISGIGIFLTGCSMMSANLESLGASKLKKLFNHAAKSKILGVGIGAAGTAAIQSSGATTVMVIGFVNAGIMTLTQAATVIYGANIGTTITGQIVAWGMSGGSAISSTAIFSAFAGIGAFILVFAKKDLWKKMGGILGGFGLLFVGLSMMAGAMESFAELEVLRNFLASIKNAVLLVAIGAVLTAIVQSSSVMTSVAITMVVSNLITLEQGIYITMGSNIGSCMVAVLASLASGKNAKRTALIHLIFNISGVIFFLLLSLVIHIALPNFSIAIPFENLFPSVPQIQLAMFHTVFNVITVVLMLPLTNGLVSLVTRLMPDSKKDKAEQEFKTHYISDYLLRTPPIAISQLKNELVYMGTLAFENFNRSLNMICKMDFTDKEIFDRTEDKINFLNHSVVSYATKVSSLSLSEKDRVYLSTAFHTTSDFERVGDYAKNIVEYAELLSSSGEKFSAAALAEIDSLRRLTNVLFVQATEAYVQADFLALEEAEKSETKIDAATDEMAKNHIKRLNEGICSPTAGSQYISLASNSERVADHLMNVARSIRHWA